MLGSIHPLGERSKGSNYWTTAVWFIAGASAAGMVLRMTLGILGSIIRARDWANGYAGIGLLIAVVLAGVFLDLNMGGLSLPTTRRQVNERWLGFPPSAGHIVKRLPASYAAAEAPTRSA
jgi:hypothetical protein